jgi:hypothetical protein
MKNWNIELSFGQISGKGSSINDIGGGMSRIFNNNISEA